MQEAEGNLRIIQVALLIEKDHTQCALIENTIGKGFLNLTFLPLQNPDLKEHENCTEDPYHLS